MHSHNQASEQTSYWTRAASWLGIGIGVILFLLVLLYFLAPLLLKKELVARLQASGMTNVRVEQLLIRAIQGEILINHLNWNTSEGRQVEIDHLLVKWQWLPLLQKQLELTDLRLVKTQLPVIIETTDPITLRIAGFNIGDSQIGGSTSKPSSNWHIAISDIDIRDGEIHLENLPWLKPNTLKSLTLKRFRANELSTSEQASSRLFSADFNLLSEQFRVNGELGGNINMRAPKLKGTIKLEQTALKPLLKQWAPSTLPLTGSGNVTAELNFEQRGTLNRPDVEANGRIDLSRADLKVNAKSPWRLTSRAFGATFTSKFQSKTSGSELSATLKPYADQLEFDSSLVNSELSKLLGQIEIAPSTIAGWQSGSLALSGRVTSAAGQLDWLQQRSNTATFASSVSQFDFSNGQLSLPLVTMEKLDIKPLSLNKQPTMVQLKLEQIQFGRNNTGQRHLDIAELFINGLQAELNIDSQGRWNLIKTIQSAAKQTRQFSKLWQPDISKSKTSKTQIKQNSTKKKQSVESTQPSWRIQRLQISPDSHLALVDSRTKPSVRADLVFDQLVLKELGLGQATIINGRAQVGSGGSIDGKGILTIADYAAGTDLKLTLNDLDLSILSPYVTREVGYRVEQGKVRGGLMLKSKAGINASEMDITIAGLSLKPVDSERILDFGKMLPRPLKIGVNLAQNKDGKINLVVPLRLKSDALELDKDSLFKNVFDKLL